jgi:hypothetical protein
MDDGFLAIAVTVFLLDDRFRLRRPLLDDGTVAIMIAMFTRCHSSADRPDVDANIIRQGGSSDGAKDASRE